MIGRGGGLRIRTWSTSGRIERVMVSKVCTWIIMQPDSVGYWLRKTLWERAKSLETRTSMALSDRSVMRWEVSLVKGALAKVSAPMLTRGFWGETFEFTTALDLLYSLIPRKVVLVVTRYINTLKSIWITNKNKLSQPWNSNLYTVKSPPFPLLSLHH